MSTNPTLLSPNSPITSPAQPIDAANITLSESDVRTLRRAIRVIEAARADAKSQDRQVAEEGSQRLANILCYVAGFIDATSAAAGLNAGFQSVFQSSLVTATDPEKQLDDLLKSLKDALEPGSTRLIANLIVGGLLIGIGIALKAIASKD